MRLSYILTIATLCLVCTAWPQPLVFTVAGADWIFDVDGRPATELPLGTLGPIAMDPNGNIYVVDSAQLRIVRIDRSGVAWHVAGSGTTFSYALPNDDGGRAIDTPLTEPRFLTADQQGNLYFVHGNGFVRKVSTSGIVTTISREMKVGVKGLAATPDGAVYLAEMASSQPMLQKISPAPPAQIPIPGLTSIDALAVGPNNALFVYSFRDSKLLVMGPNGEDPRVRTVKSLGACGFGIDGAGNIYWCDATAIVRIGLAGESETIAGSRTAQGFAGDGGAPLDARFGWIRGIAVSPGGDVFISDGDNGRVRHVGADGAVRTIAGNGRYRECLSGIPARDAWLYFPTSVAVDPGGDVYVMDSQHFRVRRISSADGTISTWVGTGESFSGPSKDRMPDGAAAETVPLPYMLTGGLASDTIGSIFFRAGVSFAELFKVWPNGALQRVFPYNMSITASNITTGFDVSAFLLGKDNSPIVADGFFNALWKREGDGTMNAITDPAVSRLTMGSISSIAAGPNGTTYVSDSSAIFAISIDGTITKMIGPAVGSRPAGILSSAFLTHPGGLLAGADGAVYFINGDRISVVSPGGAVVTLAGQANPGLCGDGDPASDACFRFTIAGQHMLAFAPGGNLYVADYGNHRIRGIVLHPAKLSFAPEVVKLSAVSGTASPSPVSIRLSANMVGLPFKASAASDGEWLHSAAPQGASLPSVLSVTVDTSGLAVGTYQGTVKVTCAYTDATEYEIPVELTIVASVARGA